jgi:hypothetical protein
MDRAILQPIKSFVRTYALVLSLLAACTSTSQNNRAETAPAGSYGEEFSDRLTTSLSEMQQEVREQGQFHGLVTGRVLEVCANKGCWMTMELPNKDILRVTFKEYSFFVPGELAGKEVLLKGNARSQRVGIEQQRHYARDAGQSDSDISAIQTEKEQIFFEAVGVKTVN